MSAGVDAGEAREPETDPASPEHQILAAFDEILELERRARLEAELARARVERLQAVTSGLSGAVTQSEVADVVFQRGLKPLGSSGAVIMYRSQDDALELLFVDGYSEADIEGFAWVGIEAHLPNSDAVRTERPVWLESPEDIERMYPNLTSVRSHTGNSAIASLPLSVHGRTIGALGLTYENAHTFSDGDRAFLLALADQCAQALERARLYDAERQSRTEIEQLAAEREGILAQIAEGIIIADAAGRITYINDTGVRILGISDLGTPISEHSGVYHTFRPDGSPYPSDELPLSRAILNGETVLDADVLIRHPDTPELMIQANAGPLVAENGDRIGGVVTFRDVTAYRDLEREKEEFLAAAAHDLKTPLTTIKGLAQLLHRQISRPAPPHPSQLLDELLQIDSTANRMVAALDEMLDLSSMPSSGSLELDRRPTDLLALVRRVVDEQSLRLGEYRIEVQSAVDELVGLWDPTRLERVLHNLLNNAVKYSPDGGPVTVTVDMLDRPPSVPHAVLTVQDRGIGIPAADLPRIFERFYRAGNVLAHIPGTGVGLAGARQIVEQHGGTISVESVEGDGSLFTVSLPLA